MGASTADVYTIVADQYRQIERLTNEMRICKELAEAAILYAMADKIHGKRAD